MILSLKSSKSKDIQKMKQPIITDGRRIYDSNEFSKTGIEYTGIGLGIQRDK